MYDTILATLILSCYCLSQMDPRNCIQFLHFFDWVSIYFTIDLSRQNLRSVPIFRTCTWVWATYVLGDIIILADHVINTSFLFNIF